MNHSRNVLIIFTALLAFAAGCQFDEGRVEPDRRPSVKSDPCAERLHDISGHLLMYHGLRKKLPAKLGDLKESGMGDLPPLKCPVSLRPYIYTPEGMKVGGRDEIMVVHDPAPSHSGMRWAILVAPPESGRTLTTRVILLTETAVKSAKKLSDTKRADAGKEKK